MEYCSVSAEENYIFQESIKSTTEITRVIEAKYKSFETRN